MIYFLMAVAYLGAGFCTMLVMAYLRVDGMSDAEYHAWAIFAWPAAVVFGMLVGLGKLANWILSERKRH